MQRSTGLPLDERTRLHGKRKGVAIGVRDVVMTQNHCSNHSNSCEGFNVFEVGKSDLQLEVYGTTGCVVCDIYMYLIFIIVVLLI